MRMATADLPRILKIFIKNIVSLSSLDFVRGELDRLGLQAVSIDINEINTHDSITPLQFDRLYLILKEAGIELFQDKRDVLVQKIKNILMEVVYHSEEPLVQNLSTHLTEKLHHDYTYMSNLFSENQHTTIEKFYICHKIERVKELLIYEKMSVTDIAQKMHYSSLAHLSGQFKKVTGLTTSQFKQQCENGDLPPEKC
jgi:YesN/AraC family two-component response regulator